MKLDSKDLIFIYAIHKMKTLDGAAQLLDKDSSSVFRAIKRIEKNIGKPIFTRSSKGFSDTEISQELSAKGELIYRALNSANDLVIGRGEILEEVLKITTTDFLLHHAVLPVIETFNQQFPQVKFEFDVSSSDDKLWERNNDIAIRPTNTPPEQMIGHHLSQLGYCVVGQPAYLASVEKDSNPRWLVFNRASKKHFIEKWFEHNIDCADCSMTFNSMFDLYHGIKSGYGVGVVPDLNAATSDLTKLAQYELQEQISIWMLYHPSSKKRALVKRFVDCVLQNKTHFQ